MRVHMLYLAVIVFIKADLLQLRSCTLYASSW